MKILPALVVVTLILAPLTARAILLTTPSGTYSQNFDTLPISGDSNTWTNDSTLPGWYAQQETGTLNNIPANTGSTATGALYSFGSTTIPADRALGSVGSGTPDDFAWGLQFENTSGNEITFGFLSYTGEQWRVGGTLSDAQTLYFSYKISSTPITLLDPGSDVGWTSISLLDFTSPITTPVGYLDGNQPANRTARTLDLGLGLSDGSSIMFRWRDIDHDSNDHGLSIDDFSVDYETASASVPESGTTVAFFGLGVFGLILFRRLRC